MKKILSSVLMFSFFLWAMGIATIPVSAEEEITAGSIIKIADDAALYYVGDDGKIYVFPNANTYFSWFEGFEDVIEVSDEAFAEYELGGAVNYKPGSLLIKTPSSLRVYAVGMNGELHWIETEEMAKEFYGDNWNMLVDDVPDSFFTNYSFGNSIDSSDDYDPDEEAENTPTISHDKGLKKLTKKVKNTYKNTTEKKCEFLKNSLNRLQQRADRWGLEIPTLGDDYLETCMAGVEQDDDVSVEGEESDEEENESDEEISGDQVYVCKMTRSKNHAGHTIKVSKNALKAHIKNGSFLGKCENDDIVDEEDEEECEGDECEEEVDETAPVISAIEEVVAATSTEISWTTDEDADSKVVFALESLTTATETTTVSDDEFVSSHSLVLDELATSTMYYYFIESIDEAGNIATSSEMTFTTLSE